MRRSIERLADLIVRTVVPRTSAAACECGWCTVRWHECGLHGCPPGTVLETCYNCKCVPHESCIIDPVCL